MSDSYPLTLSEQPEYDDDDTIDVRVASGLLPDIHYLLNESPYNNWLIQYPPDPHIVGKFPYPVTSHHQFLPSYIHDLVPLTPDEAELCLRLFKIPYVWDPLSLIDPVTYQSSQKIRHSITSESPSPHSHSHSIISESPSPIPEDYSHPITFESSSLLSKDHSHPTTSESVPHDIISTLTLDSSISPFYTFSIHPSSDPFDLYVPPTYVGSSSPYIHGNLLHTLIKLMDGLRVHNCSISEYRFSGSPDPRKFSLYLIKNLVLHLEPGLSDLAGSRVLFTGLYDPYNDPSRSFNLNGALEVATSEFHQMHPEINIGHIYLVFRFDVDPNQQCLVYDPYRSHCLVKDCAFRFKIPIEQIKKRVEKEQDIVGLQVLTPKGVLDLDAESLLVNQDVDDIKLKLKVDQPELTKTKIKWLEDLLWEYSNDDVRLEQGSTIEIEWGNERWKLIRCQVKVKIYGDLHLQIKHTVIPYKNTKIERSELCRVLECTSGKLDAINPIDADLNVDFLGYSLHSIIIDDLCTGSDWVINGLAMEIRKKYKETKAKIIFNGTMTSYNENGYWEVDGKYDYKNKEVWFYSNFNKYETFRTWIRHISFWLQKRIRRCPFSVVSDIRLCYEIIKDQIRIECKSELDQNADMGEESDMEEDQYIEKEIEEYKEDQHVFKIIYKSKKGERERSELKFECIQKRKHKCDIKEIFKCSEYKIDEEKRRAILIFDPDENISKDNKIIGDDP